MAARCNAKADSILKGFRSSLANKSPDMIDCAKSLGSNWPLGAWAADAAAELYGMSEWH
jgi:hypothetical protein